MAKGRNRWANEARNEMEQMRDTARQYYREMVEQGIDDAVLRAALITADDALDAAAGRFTVLARDAR
jgi:hypothetical protein